MYVIRLDIMAYFDLLFQSWIKNTVYIRNNASFGSMSNFFNTNNNDLWKKLSLYGCIQPIDISSALTN